MIARHTPIGHGRGWLAAGLLLALAVTGPTVADHRIPAGDPPDAAPAQAGAEPRQAAEPIPKPIADAIAILRKTETRQPARWAPAIRTLAQIGRPAVPYLIEELDRTTEGLALGSLAFTLRAIGDPRAVPALIRASRARLSTIDGDFGLRGVQPRTARVPAKARHQTRGRTAGSSRSARPIMRSPARCTRSPVNDSRSKSRCTSSASRGRRGSAGSSAGSSTSSPRNGPSGGRRTGGDSRTTRLTSEISLPPLPEAPQVAAAAADQPFPTGNRVQVSSGPANAIVGPPQALDYYRTFTDLDTGRELAWPEELPDSSKVKGDEVAAFAAREGLDLRGIEYTPPGSGRSYYAIQGLGLRAWQIDNSRYYTIEQDLRAGRPPKLDRPAGDLLMDVDPRTGTPHPENKATFLFVTREGTTGALQLNGLVTGLPGPDEVRMRLRPPDPPEEPGKPAPLAIGPRGLPRGAVHVQVPLHGGGRGPVIRASLGRPRFGRPGPDQPAPPPITGPLPPAHRPDRGLPAGEGPAVNSTSSGISGALVERDGPVEGLDRNASLERRSYAMRTWPGAGSDTSPTIAAATIHRRVVSRGIRMAVAPSPVSPRTRRRSSRPPGRPGGRRGCGRRAGSGRSEAPRTGWRSVEPRSTGDYGSASPRRDHT